MESCICEATQGPQSNFALTFPLITQSNGQIQLRVQIALQGSRAVKKPLVADLKASFTYLHPCKYILCPSASVMVLTPAKVRLMRWLSIGSNRHSLLRRGEWCP